MAAFQNIKQACSLISKLNAQTFAEQSGWELPKDMGDEADPFAGRENELIEIVQKRGIRATHGPVQSGAYDKEENWIDFIALTQAFEKHAPKLRTILNEVARSFKIDLGGEVIPKTNKGYKARLNVSECCDQESPDLIAAVSYFITSEDTYIVNLTSKKLGKVKGQQLGGAGTTEHGAAVEFNVEIVPKIGSVIHELIHIKWPEEIPQMDEAVENISVVVAEILTKQGYGAFLNDQEIQEERTQALEAFKLLDTDLMQFFES